MVHSDPIRHVNAYDPVACLASARLAMAYRDKFHSDVVIDVVGYRRHGHNEGDEPAYTQPLMYERIKQTPTVRQRYADRLAREGVLDAAQAEAEAERTYQQLAEIQQSLKAHLAEGGAGGEPAKSRSGSRGRSRRWPSPTPRWQRRSSRA